MQMDICPTAHMNTYIVYIQCTKIVLDNVSVWCLFFEALLLAFLCGSSVVQITHLFLKSY